MVPREEDMHKTRLRPWGWCADGGGGTGAENLLTQKASYETKACMPAEAAAAAAGRTEKDDGYTSRCLERGVRGRAVNGEEVPSPAKRCLFLLFSRNNKIP